MIRRTIATGVGAGLEAGRLPLKMVGPLLPARIRGVVELGADQVQALAEAKVGGLLGDARLTERGHQRRIAADQRAEAVRLWGEAGKERRQADLQLAEERSEAEQRRRRAKEQEQEQRKAVQEAKEAARDQAEQTAKERKAAVRNAATERKAAGERKAKEQRLEVLETEDAALDETEVALTAADEAARLKTAAAEAKARRRTG